MTIPPQALTAHPHLLDFAGVMDLRSPAGELVERVTSTEAFCLAVRYHIEGVASNGGKLRFLRMLPMALADAIAGDARMEADDIDSGMSTAFARTNQGTFREPLREAQVDQDGEGFRQVTGEGGVVSFCYTHCSLRRLRFKREPRAVAA